MGFYALAPWSILCSFQHFCLCSIKPAVTVPAEPVPSLPSVSMGLCPDSKPVESALGAKVFCWALSRLGANLKVFTWSLQKEMTQEKLYWACSAKGHRDGSKEKLSGRWYSKNPDESLGFSPPCATGPVLLQDLLTALLKLVFGDRGKKRRTPSASFIAEHHSYSGLPITSFIYLGLNSQGKSRAQHPFSTSKSYSRTRAKQSSSESQGQHLPSADTESTLRSWPPRHPPGTPS